MRELPMRMEKRFSSLFIKVISVLTASLTLACGLPTTANAITFTNISCPISGRYQLSNLGVVLNGGNCAGAVTIDARATSIGDYAFYANAGLTSITIPIGVTRIGQGAFWAAADLIDISIPSSVTSIGDYAFYNMASSTTITVDNANAAFSSIDGVLFSKSQTGLLVYPAGKIANPYVIPEAVTSLSNYAFARSRFLTSITIPNSLTSIGTNTFEDSNSLTSITIPSSVTSIGSLAFNRTSSLTSFQYCGSADLTGTGLIGITQIPCIVPGLTPTLAIASGTTSSFSVQVTNFDAAYTYSVATTSGSASINGSGLATVGSLSSTQSATLTVTTTRAGYTTESATAVGISQATPMQPGTSRPALSITSTSITCTIGSYSSAPTSAVFSLFVAGQHISTNFSALGDFLPDWIIGWATPATITRTATLTSATWDFSESYRGKRISCSTLAYANHATGTTTSANVVVN